MQLPARPALVADRHPLAAAPAGHQPGQQGRAITHRAHALGPGPVGVHPLPIPLVLLDADIGGQQPRQEDDPVLARGPHPPGERPPGLPPPGIHGAAAIGVDPSVGRVAEHVLHPGPARPAPRQLPALGSLTHPHSELDVVVRQEAQHRIHRAQPLEQVEDQADHGLDLLIGIQGHLARGAAHETGRQRHGQLPPPGLGQPPRPHPLLDQVQLSLADRPLQPQQEAVIVVDRVVYSVRIAQQGPRQGTQLQELVPFPATARQPGHLDAQHDAHMVQPDLGDQTLKARPCVHPRRRMPQVLIDHQHPRRRPPQGHRPLRQPILQPRGFLMVMDLLSGGLTHINGRETITMPRLDLALQPLPRPRRRAHPAHPRPCRSRDPPAPSSARPASSAGAPPAPGSSAGTLPTAAPRPAKPLTGGHDWIC